MAAPDLDVIKDIPGYKVILKAVLKSQIQQLVEQLAATTDEESVILTASVADGTLSHLGSKSGKGFLEDHEDIKSQFLGFCLKRHHRQKQEREQQEAEVAAKQAQQVADRHMYPRGRYPAVSPRFPSLPGSGPVHPVAMIRAPGGGRLKSQRHEPYQITRPRSRRTSTESSPVGINDDGAQLIKIEPNVETAESDNVSADTQGNSNLSQSELSNAPSCSRQEPGEDETESESSSSNTPNEPPPEGFGEESNQSVSVSNQEQGGERSEIDTNVIIKMEELTENEMDLEITGVEPGRSLVPQDSWDPNMSVGMNFDPTGAMGNQGDMPALGYSLTREYEDVNTDQGEDAGFQPYTKVHSGNRDFYHCCHGNCRKFFASKYLIERHIKIHKKEKPFACRFCDYKCVRKDYMRVHESNKHSAEILDMGLI